MARLRAPAVRKKLVPFFNSVELSALKKACRGNTFAQRRDPAIVSVFRATGIRLAELAGKDRTVRIDHEPPGGSTAISGSGPGMSGRTRAYPHRFRHHLSHTWLERGGAEGDLMELNGCPPRRCCPTTAAARGARVRRHYDLIMRD